MEQLLEAIRAATATDASDETKAAGASACRTLLLALEAKPGQPLATPPMPSNAVEAAVSVFRGMPVEQLLDLAIARIKAVLPPETVNAPVQPLKVPLVSLPQIGRQR